MKNGVTEGVTSGSDPHDTSLHVLGLFWVHPSTYVSIILLKTSKNCPFSDPTHLFTDVIFSSKVCSEIKETTFRVGHFTTISGHSIANYINIFHKTEVPTVILRCLMSLNLNWIKSYDINYKLFWQLCFSILEEKKASKMAIFWPFVVFFWQLHRYLSQNWDSEGHFEVLSVSKS